MGFHFGVEAIEELVEATIRANRVMRRRIVLVSAAANARVGIGSP
jgi:hypothetical protein